MASSKLLRKHKLNCGFNYNEETQTLTDCGCEETETSAEYAARHAEEFDRTGITVLNMRDGPEATFEAMRRILGDD